MLGQKEEQVRQAAAQMPEEEVAEAEDGAEGVEEEAEVVRLRTGVVELRAESKNLSRPHWAWL